MKWTDHKHSRVGEKSFRQYLRAVRFFVNIYEWNNVIWRLSVIDYLYSPDTSESMEIHLDHRSLLEKFNMKLGGWENGQIMSENELWEKVVSFMSF